MIESQAGQLRLDRVAREVSRATGSAVAAGPFAGMRLDYELLPVHASPKFLGTYKRELHGVIERAIQLRPKYVLNIGCAEGFYAVGLAIRVNDAQVFAADADPKALLATVKNAELNGVAARVRPVGIVTPRQLGRYLKSDASLLVMDCEGAEFSLLSDGAPVRPFSA
jgi:2-polyprenyl-3-methyl-5-hydroxy-6-metoxy-1,4-benzoquinol methylase